MARSSPPCVISARVCTICGPSPPPPCDLLHSGKEMEVIHSGNCDCPFPGKDAPGRPPVIFPQRPRPPPHVSQGGLAPRPAGRTEEEAGACAARPSGVSPPPAATAGRPRALGSPPSALCYSPTSCLWSPTPAHFQGREAAEGREFLGDTPTGSLLLSPPPPGTRAGREPREAGALGGRRGGTAGRSPDTRGRRAPVQAAVLLEAPETAPGHSWGPVQAS